MDGKPQADACAIRTGDRAVPFSGRPLPVAVVLDRLRSAFNVGNIFRLGDALNVEMIATCGYTATPPHAKLAKTARGSELTVPCTHFADAAVAVAALKQRGYTVFAVETVQGARQVWDMECRFPAAFVFGNEALGICPQALELADHVVAVPMFGLKNSINVGNCAAVVLYEAARQALRKQQWKTDGI